MKTIIVYRKNGRIIIEAPKDAEVSEIIKEHEITNFLKIETHE